MIPLEMIMIDEFGERPANVAASQRNHPIEALRFDRADEAFGMRVGIGRLIGRPHHADHALS